MKRFFAIVWAVLVVMMPLEASAAANNSGKWGDLLATFDPSDQTLYFSALPGGSGRGADYKKVSNYAVDYASIKTYAPPPYAGLSVERVVIAPGVKSLGAGAVSCVSGIQDVVGEEHLEKVDNMVFSGSLSMPEEAVLDFSGAKTIELLALRNCKVCNIRLGPETVIEPGALVWSHSGAAQTIDTSLSSVYRFRDGLLTTVDGERLVYAATMEGDSLISGCTSMEAYAFMGTRFTEARFPNLQRVGDCAFMWSTGNIYLPNGVHYSTREVWSPFRDFLGMVHCPEWNGPFGEKVVLDDWLQDSREPEGSTWDFSWWVGPEGPAAVEAGVFPPFAAGHLQESANREEAAEYIYVLLLLYKPEIAAATPATPFADCDSSAVLALRSLDVVNGKGQNLFHPDDKLTRVEYLVMLSRALAALGVPQGGMLQFDDCPTWAQGQIAVALQEAGVLRGTAPGTLSPYLVVTHEMCGLLSYRTTCAW